MSGLFGSRGGGAPATTTVDKEPAKWAQGPLRWVGNNIVSRGEELPATPVFRPQWSTGLRGAQQGLVDATQRFSSTLNPSTQSAYQGILSQTPFNPQTMGAIKAAQQGAARNFSETTMPALRQKGFATGNTGSSRQGIAEGIAARDFQQQQSDTAAAISESARQKQLDAQVKAMALGPTLMSSLTAPQQARLASEQAQNQLGESQRLSDMQALYNRQVAPFQRLSNIISTMGAGSQFGGGVDKQVQRSAGSTPSGGSQALGAILQALPIFF